MDKVSDYELTDGEKKYNGTDANELIKSSFKQRMLDVIPPGDREDDEEDDEEWDDEKGEWVTVPKEDEDEDEEWYELEALSVEKDYSFRIVLGCGGPSDWFQVECDEDGDINEITYHYAWSGHAERRLWGNDRKAVEAWIERVGLNPFARY